MDYLGLERSISVWFTLSYWYAQGVLGSLGLDYACSLPPPWDSSLACLLAGLLASRLAAGCPPASLPPSLPASLPPLLACLLACVRVCLLACWLSLLKWVLGGLAALPSSLAGLLACWLASCRSTFEDRFLKKKGESGKKNMKIP